MKFDSREICGGPVRNRRVTVDLRRGDRLYVFCNVPIGMCAKCGERYYPGPILKQLDELAEHAMDGRKTLAVPTMDFTVAKAS